MDRGEAHCAGSEDCALWSALADSLDDLVMVVDAATGEVLDVNAVARRESPGEGDPVGKLLVEVCSPELAAGVPVMLAAVAQSPERRFVRRQVTWAGRGVVPVEVVTTPVTWRGRPAAVVVVRDTSARAALMRQSMELAEAEQRFREAFDEAAIGMALVATGPHPPAGTFLEVNRALGTLVGRTPEELTNVTFSSISHPEDTETGLAVFESVARGETPRGVVEKRYLHADGHEVWVRVTISSVHTPTGEVRYLVG